jgi:hypothetical protein
MDSARAIVRDLDYVRDSGESYNIRVPVLTNRETRLLDRHVPAVPSGVHVSMVPKPDRDDYAATYRFFPTFVDAQF